MATQDLDQQLIQWDAWIREGQVRRVRGLCRELNHKKIPREKLVDYANIARRVGAPDLIILWLHPIVYSDKSLQQKASFQERAIYGLGLLRVGAFAEAEKILDTVDPSADPQVYFYRASLQINQWNYKKALTPLRKYISHPQVPAYQKLVGRLNLCASLVALRSSDDAELEIATLLKKLIREKHQLLQGHLLEIRSQLRYEQEKYQEAIADLENSNELLAKADDASLIYVEKWKLLSELMQAPHSNETLQKIDSLKRKAKSLKEWELIRDCDLHVASAQQSSDLLLKVYWGSLFPNYKEKVKAMSKAAIGNEDIYSWFPSEAPRSPEHSQAYDLTELAPTKLLKSLFFALTRDFYRPLRNTEILSALYPDEYYNPVSGPAKLQRLVARAHKWLLEQDIPFRIVSYRNSYKLEAANPKVNSAVVVKGTLQTRPKTYLPKELMTQKNFSAHEWAEFAGVSVRTALRQIEHHIKMGQIEAFAFGPRSRYRFT